MSRIVPSLGESHGDLQSQIELQRRDDAMRRGSGSWVQEYRCWMENYGLYDCMVHSEHRHNIPEPYSGMMEYVFHLDVLRRRLRW